MRTNARAGQFFHPVKKPLAHSNVVLLPFRSLITTSLFPGIRPMNIPGLVRSILPESVSAKIERLLANGPNAAKTPPFAPNELTPKSGAANAALSHVINTLTPNAAQRSAPVKSAPPPKSSGTVFVPASAGVKGDERATQRSVVLAAVNRYYKDKGYDFSRAAIEEAAGRLELDVKNLELTYLRDAKGDMARDPNGKPIMGYYVTLTPEGATGAKNAEVVREADTTLDAFIPEAKRMTEAGTPSVTDKTQMQRFEMLRQAYVKRHGPDAAERLKDSFTSLENMGVLVGGTVLMSTPLAPAVMAVGGYGLTKETIELAGLSDDIGKGLSLAERPSDIEKLTPKLDELVQRAALLTVNMAAGAGLMKGAGAVKSGANGVTTGGPTAVAPVTENGVPFPVPVTLRAPQLPTRPTGGGSPLPNALDVAPTGLPPVAPERALGLTPTENVGGSAGRPDAMLSKGVRSGTGGGNAYELKVRAERLELKAENFVKVIDGDKLTQAKGVTNQNAADHIGFVKQKSGLYTVQISEITTGNKDLKHLARQLEGGAKIAYQDKEFGHLIVEPKYRVFTDNPELIKALAKDGNKIKIGKDEKPVEVIDTRSARR
jgi:hypothetical protein